MKNKCLALYFADWLWHKQIQKGNNLAQNTWFVSPNSSKLQGTVIMSVVIDAVFKTIPNAGPDIDLECIFGVGTFS